MTCKVLTINASLWGYGRVLRCPLGLRNLFDGGLSSYLFNILELNAKAIAYINHQRELYLNLAHPARFSHSSSDHHAHPRHWKLASRLLQSLIFGHCTTRYFRLTVAGGGMPDVDLMASRFNRVDLSTIQAPSSLGSRGYVGHLGSAQPYLCFSLFQVPFLPILEGSRWRAFW